MLISASRRTDLPAFYADWLLRRIQAGEVMVRNPYQPRHISLISLDPEVVDGMVLWTKNPIPLLRRLDALDCYMTVFQVTLTPYGPEVEPGIPEKWTQLLPAFQALSRRLGPERVIWRYDPIFLSERYTVSFHLDAFSAMAKALSPYTRRCIISFLDSYRDTAARMAPLRLAPFPPARQRALAGMLAECAAQYRLPLFTCAETIDLSDLGIGHSACVDGALFASLLGEPLTVRPDRHQRPACGCCESVDIGAYGTCPGGCLYCYANRGVRPQSLRTGAHHPDSPLLFGLPGPEDTITRRAASSSRSGQAALW